MSAQDGIIPDVEDPARHQDGIVYRNAALRECFEECGILLAKTNVGSGDVQEAQMVMVEEKEREETRRKVHAEEVRFLEWVKGKGGMVDVGKYSLTQTG